MRLLTSLTATLLIASAILIGLYQYQHNWDDLSELPIVRELTTTYQLVAAPLTKADIAKYYAYSDGELSVRRQRDQKANQQSGKMVVYSTWNKDSLLRQLSFSKRKMKQAQRYISYIDAHKAIALRDMYHHKIPASIKLAQALLESNAGQSKLALNTNNHFGIKARAGKSARKKIKARHYAALKDEEFIPVSPAIGAHRYTDDHSYDRFEVYHRVSDSYLRHTRLLTRSCAPGRKGCYAWIWDRFPPGSQHSIAASAEEHYRASKIRATNFFDGQTSVPYYAACAAGLKMAGYATSPTYHKKITYIIETYELWRFDLDLLRAVAEAN